MTSAKSTRFAALLAYSCGRNKKKCPCYQERTMQQRGNLRASAGICEFYVSYF